MIRILLADDHTLYREGLKILLEREGLAVIGEAADGHEALQLALELKPDVTVLDLTMPGLGGIEVIRELRQRQPDAKIVLLSMHEEETWILNALRFGASGYVFKTQTDRDLVHTIEMVAKGAFYLGPNIPHSVVDALTHNAPQVNEPLTQREQEVVKLIADGMSYREIAAILGLSPKTVESHRGRIMQKLKLEQTTQLICYAVRTQLARIMPAH